MADRRIDQLTESESINDDDLFVIWKNDISQTRSIQMQNAFNIGIQTIIDRITQWEDVTSDFNITGSTNSGTLLSVKYNSALKKLYFKYTRTSSFPTGTTVFNLYLNYTGENENIAFSDNIVCRTTHISNVTYSPMFSGVTIVNDKSLLIKFHAARSMADVVTTGSIFTGIIEL